MEEQLSQLAITHLLQHTLRSLCIHENSQWVYAVFWRILPRNYPPPKWDCQGGAYDRSRGNRRNWILVWEDGFCNFAASAAEIDPSDYPPSRYAGHDLPYQQYQGLQPELFFKMSHEIYNYGEGLIGKVSADQSHKWVFKEPNDQEINFLTAWNNSADSYPRTWEAQFQSGIKTIALIAVREGVIQLGSTHKVIEDLSYVVLLRKKLSYIESIPGVLLPHPSSSSFPHPSYKMEGYSAAPPESAWHANFQGNINLVSSPPEFYHNFIGNNNNNNTQPGMNAITPSMSSLEALLSTLPSVVPMPLPSSQPHPHHPQYLSSASNANRSTMEFMGMAEKVMITKEEEVDHHEEKDVDESSGSLSSYRLHRDHFSYCS